MRQIKLVLVAVCCALVGFALGVGTPSAGAQPIPPEERQSRALEAIALTLQEIKKDQDHMQSDQKRFADNITGRQNDMSREISRTKDSLVAAIRDVGSKCNK